MQDGKILINWNSSHLISIHLKFIETESLCIKCQPFVQLCLLRIIKWYWITASEWAFQGQPWQFVAIKMQILFQHSITKDNAYFWKHILFFPPHMRRLIQGLRGTLRLLAAVLVSTKIVTFLWHKYPHENSCENYAAFLPFPKIRRHREERC